MKGYVIVIFRGMEMIAANCWSSLSPFLKAMVRLPG